MRQRNTSGHVVDVAAYPDDEHPDQRPFTLGPGEEIDFRELLGGCTSLEPDPVPAKTVRKRATDAAPIPEGAEQP